MDVKPRSDYDRCGCGGWKRKVAKQCANCHLTARRHPPSAYVCPDCGGRKATPRSPRCRQCWSDNRIQPRIHGGYLVVVEHGHPLADSRGRVLVHRKVMHDAGIEIPPGFHVHHRNGDRLDNRLENLEVIEPSAHTTLHVRSAGKVTNQFGEFPILEHGLSPYRRGCRCDVCRKANTDYCREQRRLRRLRQGAAHAWVRNG